MTDQKLYTLENMTTAMCLWEDILYKLRDEELHPEVRQFLSAFGVAQAREYTALLAPMIDRAYAEAPDRLKDGVEAPFDWKIAPEVQYDLMQRYIAWWNVTQPTVNNHMHAVLARYILTDD